MALQVITQGIEANLEQAQTAVVDLLVETYNPVFYSLALRNHVSHDVNASLEQTLALSDLQDGTDLRLAAGQVSKLTITGLADWRFINAQLTFTNTSARYAMPAPGSIVHQSTNNLYGGDYARIGQIEPPVFVHSFVTESKFGSFSTLTSTENAVTGVAILAYDAPAIEARNINAKINSVSSYFSSGDLIGNRAALIIDNAPAGIAVSTAEDQILHRIVQALAVDQSATTPDLSETFNTAATTGTLTLNILSQSNGILHVTGTQQRTRFAIGHSPDMAEFAITPWQSAVIAPVKPDPDLPQTTRITGTLRATGPAHLGLMETTPSAFQIHAHPRLRLAQPFQPKGDHAETPITITGCWLMLEEAPQSEGTLTLAVHKWDSAKNTTGAEICTTTATISPALMDHDIGPEGRVAAWLPFTMPWVLDTPEQSLLHGLVLSAIDGNLRLLETPHNHPRLQPLLSKDIRRDTGWTQRNFGASAKALVFELGYTTPSDTIGTLTVSSLGDTKSVAVHKAETAFSAILKSGDVTLSSDVNLKIEKLSCETETGIFG